MNSDWELPEDPYEDLTRSKQLAAIIEEQLVGTKPDAPLILAWYANIITYPRTST